MKVIKIKINDEPASELFVYNNIRNLFGLTKQFEVNVNLLNELLETKSYYEFSYNRDNILITIVTIEELNNDLLINPPMTEVKIEVKEGYCYYNMNIGRYVLIKEKLFIFTNQKKIKKNNELYFETEKEFCNYIRNNTCDINLSNKEILRKFKKTFFNI